jgi:DNA-binding NarL/FixJ family response regulator
MRTLLVDDHALFREGLSLLMAHRFPGLRLAEVGTLEAALVHLSSPDASRLVLLDLALPDSQGLDGLRRVREVAPSAVVVVLSADASAPTVLAALDAGAAGFIPKSADARALQAGLQAVLAGGVALPPAVLGGMVAPPSPPLTPTAEPLGLSPRQADVLALLIEGRSNKLICRELGLSESTVKTHLASIFRKLDVGTRTQAVVAAARLGLRLRHPG